MNVSLSLLEAPVIAKSTIVLDIKPLDDETGINFCVLIPNTTFIVSNFRSRRIEKNGFGYTTRWTSLGRKYLHSLRQS